MKIAYDISQIVFGTGVSHYRKNLIKNLLEIDRENSYLLYGFSLRRIGELQEFASSLPGNVETKFFPIPLKVLDLLWNKLHIFKIENLIGNVDLVHTSDWLEPPSEIKKVTTVHDLIPLKYPKLTPKSIVSVHRKKLSWVLEESEKIIVPSQVTKDDLVSIGADPEKVEVVYESNNLSKADAKKVEEVKSKYKIHSSYLIAIGTNPRKNIDRIIDAFNLSKAGRDLKLIVVGEIPKEAKQQRGVRYLGYVNDSDLSALLTGASALAFPSLYEGLGVPILDAFACDTPVVTSNISSMPEVAGNAAIYVNPNSTGSIAEGIGKALSKPKTLIAKGRTQLKNFSWSICAAETLKIYKMVKSEDG